jgi:tetratricopeptide (TPR) repeat protein
VDTNQVPVDSFSFFYRYFFQRIPAIFFALTRLIFRTLRNVLLLFLTTQLSVAVHAQTKTSNPAQFKSLSEQAAKASSENRLDEAATLYQKALTLRPRWTEGWWALGTLEYEQDRYAKAAQSFEKLIALDPKNGTAHAMLGLCQFELRQDQPALKNLLAAEQLGVLKNAQLRKVALYHLGVLQLRVGRYGAAKESFGQLARDGIRSRDLTNGLGLAALLIKHQDSPAAGTPGATVVERAGEAELLLTANDFEQAKQRYALLTAEFPDYPNLHFAFGRLLLETHDNDHAVREFQLELKRDPKHVNAMLEIAVARQQVDPQEGLKYAEEAARLVPRLPFAHYILGMLRLDTGDATGAIPDLETAQKAFPNEAGVYFALGRAYARVGRKAEAAKARAEFARLNAEAAKQSGPTIYGSETKTLDKERP